MNNPFEQFYAQTSEGSSANNYAEQTNSAAESVVEKVQEVINNTADQYNPGTAEQGFNAIGGKIVETAQEFIKQITDNDVFSSGLSQLTAHCINGGIIAVAAVVAIATAAVLIHGFRKGFTRSQKIKRAETKINASSKKYFTVKKVQREYSELEKMTDENKIAKKHENINKLQQKIEKEKLVAYKLAKEKKYYTSHGMVEANIGANKLFRNSIFENGKFNKKNTFSHFKAMNNLASAEIIGRSERSNKKYNKLVEKAKNQIEKINIGDLIQGIHFSNVSYPVERKNDEQNIPLFLHRAITDNEELNAIFDKANERFPFAEKTTKFFKIKLYDSNNTSLPVELKCCFDNDIAFRYCKSAILVKVLEELENNNSLNKIEISEYTNKTKTKNIDSETYNLNNPDSASKFFSQTQNARETIQNIEKNIFRKQEAEQSM